MIRGFFWLTLTLVLGAMHIALITPIHEAGHCMVRAWPETCTVETSPRTGQITSHGPRGMTPEHEHVTIVATHFFLILATIVPPGTLALKTAGKRGGVVT